MCVPQGMKQCAANEQCDEAADMCVCAGCVVGGSCVASGAVDPSNKCMVCTPATSKTAYSPSVGKTCGSAQTECSGQDTCDASGTCQPNDVMDGTTCSIGECTAGSCMTVPNPFDCIAPDPPVFDPDTLDAVLVSGTAPSPMGGTIPSGRYMPIKIQFYGDQPSTTSVYSFEFDRGFVQVAYQPYPPWVPQIQFAGTFTPSGNTLQFDLERCDPQYTTDVPNLQYTVTANGMMTFETTSGTRVVISYQRQ